MPRPVELDSAVEPRSSTAGSVSDAMVFRSLSSPEIAAKGKYHDSTAQNGAVKSSTIINSNPQNYINVDGATYKVSRIQSPRALPTETPSGSLLNRTSLEDLPPKSFKYNNHKDTMPLELESSSSNLSRQSSTESEKSYSTARVMRSQSFDTRQEEQDVTTLAASLADARNIISCQENEIQRLQARVAYLEKMVPEHLQAEFTSEKCPKVSSSLRNQILQVKTSDLNYEQSILASASAPVSLRRDRSIDSNNSDMYMNDFITPTGMQTAEVDSNFTAPAGYGGLGLSSKRPPLSSTPSSSDQSKAMSEISVSPPTSSVERSSGQEPVGGNDVAIASLKEEFLSPSAAPKNLTDRLSMNSQERRKLAASQRLKGLPRAASSGSLSKHQKERPIVPRLTQLSTRPNTSNVPMSTGSDEDRNLFSKLRETASSTPVNMTPSVGQDVFEWSDAKEPQLFVLHDSPQLGLNAAAQIRSSSTNSMEVMFESKDEKGVVHFVLGSITWSGGMEQLEGADPNNPRGSQCFVCSSLTAYKVEDIKRLPTKVNGEIIEIQLTGDDELCTKIDVSTVEKLKAFLKTCAARVDVILDPSHNEDWYPYWEAKRKMAPQFRSKGIGYIRLGDDMSMYGVAFMSTDAGKTFLDDGAAQEWRNEETLGGSGKFNNVLESTGGSSRPRSTSSYSTSSSEGTSARTDTSRRRGVDEIKDIVSRLRGIGPDDSSKEIKWAERCELLNKLARLCTCAFDNATVLAEMLSVLAENVSRQTNPHVVRAAIQCVKTLGGGYMEGSSAVVAISALNASGLAWRKLLLSALHTVRASNKTISDEAKETLDSLHGITLSVGGLMPNLEEILIGPRGGKGSSAGSASNSSKVVNWLNSLLRKELHILLTRSLGIAPQVPYNLSSTSSSPDYTTSSDATTSASTSTASPRPNTARIMAASGQFFEKIDTSTGCQKAKQLLWHREETTRESAVQLIAAFLSIDALSQVGDNSVGNVSSSGSYTGGLFTIARQLSRRLSTQAAGGKGSVISIVTNCLSPGCKAVLVEIERSASRMYEKVLIAAANMIVDSTGAFSPADAKHSHQPTSARGSKSTKTSQQGEKPSSKNSVRGGKTPSESKQTYITPSSSSTSNPLDAVSGLWFEATLVLKHTPKTEEDWQYLKEVTKNSKNFFDQMTKSAVIGGIPRGSLLQNVLPFDNVTSLSDQADTSHMTPLKSVPGISDETLVTLREQAVTLRKLIRVKMADEADLNQAQMAITTLDKLITGVSKIDMPLTEILQGLK